MWLFKSAAKNNKFSLEHKKKRLADTVDKKEAVAPLQTHSENNAQSSHPKSIQHANRLENFSCHIAKLKPICLVNICQTFFIIIYFLMS